MKLKHEFICYYLVKQINLNAMINYNREIHHEIERHITFNL